jgi:hypothetical protein
MEAIFSSTFGLRMGWFRANWKYCRRCYERTTPHNSRLRVPRCSSEIQTQIGYTTYRP